MTENDHAFHDSMKPSWGPGGTLVYAVSSNAKPLTRSSRRARDKDGLLTVQKGEVVSERRDVRFAKFSNEVSSSFCIYWDNSNYILGLCGCTQEAQGSSDHR
jgi:nuclear pore complex protein Nup98-Nup96